MTERLMKDSGIEWIGDYPNDWCIARIKDFFNFQKGKNAQLYTQIFLGEHIGDIPVYSGQTENEGIMGLTDRFDYNVDSCLFTTTVGAKVMSPKYLTGKFCLSQNCMIMIKKKECSDKFFYYSLFPLFDYKKSIIPSYMQPSLRVEDMKTFNVVLPKLLEQEKIANFLDSKCFEIDNLTKDIEHQIETLEEYKKSVIAEAVTKGLNPDVEMKDSGVDWIGKIPKNWTIRRIKTLGEYRNGLTYSPTDMCDENEGTLVLRSSNVQKGKIVYDDNVYVKCSVPKDLYVKQNDILICSRNGSRELVGKNALIVNDDKETFGAFMMIYRTKYYRFMYYALNSNQMSYYLGSFFTSTINQLTGFNFGNMKFIYCPDENEQQEIADYLDAKCSEIDSIISDKKKQIEILTEYKKSLIYEYVTGKKEVE